MAGLKRHDIAAYGDVLMVIVESDLLPPDPAVVVIPLLRDYPAVAQLNPVIRHGGGEYFLATRLIAAVRRSSLRKEGNGSQHADDITRAIDLLMSGI